jgi:signal transduction histidine kinase
MENLRIIILLVNGISLSLSLAFLLIILWFENKKSLIYSLALFLFLVTFWHGSMLLYEVMLIIDPRSELTNFLSLVDDIGFAGSSVGIYVFVSSLIVAHTRLLRFLAILSLGLIVLSNAIVLQSNVTDNAINNAPIVGVSVLYFLLFDMVALYLTVRYRSKIRSQWLVNGLILFIVGQGLVFFNPELGIVTLALLLTGVGMTVISGAIVQRELISPLGERISQVETMQQITLSIMQRSTLELVADEATQAVVNWLEADAAVVFIYENSEFSIASSYDIPADIFIVTGNEGVLRETVKGRKPLMFDNYTRDWKGNTDFQYDQEIIGSIMSIPLFSNAQILGVLLVLSGRRNKLFEQRELRLLEQLSNQVAVAISHSQLFESVALAHGQLQTVLTSTYNPVIAINKDLKVIFSNPTAKSLIRSVIKDDVEDIIYGIIPLPQKFIPTNLRDFVEQINSEGFFRYEYDFEHSIYICRIARLRSTQTDGWVAVLNDITQLRELDRMKNEMVRMTSHDLKNPIQAAVANLDLLREDIDSDNAEIMLSVDLIEKQLNKMSRIIGGILDLERLEIGQEAVDNTHSIYEILKQAVEEVEDYAIDGNVNLFSDFDSLQNVDIKGDFHQLKRAFVNLLDNAIKFTPQDGMVSCKGVNDNNSEIRIEIEDSGVGIPEELYERIFHRFFRGQQTQYEHVSGSGLGLSFVKSIVTKHGGSISVKSDYGHGSCFTVILHRSNEFV